MAGVPIDLVTVRSRSGSGRRVMYSRVVPVESDSGVHTFLDLDPYENESMEVLLACE